MPKFVAPWPYDLELNGQPYLYPPREILGVLNSPAYQRESLPWFAERIQQDAVSESLFPPQAETSATAVDRSGGFGYSDAHHVAGVDSDEAPKNVYAYTDAVDAGTSGDGQGVDCSVEGVAFLAPKTNAVALTGGGTEMRADFELTVGGTRYSYVVAGTKMFRSSDGTTYSGVQANGSDLPAALSGRPIVYQGAQTNPQVYFPMGDGQTFRTWDGNTANSFGSPAAGDVQEWIDAALIDDVAYVLWYDTVSDAFRVSSFDDGIAGGSSGTTPSYTPSIAVSDGADAARVLMTAHDTLYIGCDRTLKALDSERNQLHQTIWRTTAPGANNFRWWTQWRDELWFTADQGVYRIKPDGGGFVFESVGPETLSNNRTPVRGVVRAKAGDDYCLYGFLRTEAGVTYLLKYRYYDQGRRAAWHCISRIGTYDVNHAFVSTIQGTNPRLYFGTTATEMRYIVLPRNGFYPPSDSNCEYTDKGYLFETRMHGGMYAVNKSLFAFTGRAESLTSSETITPYYKTDLVASFTQFGTTSLTVDPGSRLQLDEPAGCAWWEGRLRLVRGGTTTLTPKLLAATWGHKLTPVAKGAYAFWIWAAERVKNKAGGIDQRSVAEIVETLEQLDSSQQPVPFVNAWGQEKSVFVNEVKVLDYTTESDQPSQAVVRVTAVEFAARTAGTWDIAGGLTWDQAASYTWDALSQLIG